MPFPSYQRSNEIVELTLNYIGYNKMQGRYPDDMSLGKMEVYPQEKECLRLWHIYETRMREMLTLDFDDLLLKTIHILDQYPEVRTRWQKKIDHILIDEFQDTNDVQYRLVKLLMRPSTCLYVVGDPDQTIYTWRGANQNIILDLTEEYPVDTIILDRNYRSTSKILDTANKLIDHNRKRVKKNLYTENGPGSDIAKYRGYTMDEEADFVMREITSLARTPGFSYRDVAVLYRSSYLTLPFEKAFMARHIPYVIFGGLRFYQRKEIKDVLAYFRLLINGKDDISFERIINIPKRGIGERSVELIKS
ncbi:MAG: ATP-dependent DNA helicase PcrA, partial [Methanomicrobia archaeon]|nr:ATP-dependent DNA helicase PcrA [Methanomicrobia archaeon]